MNETVSILPGGKIVSYQPHGFSQIYAVWIDNFSGGWMGLEGLNLWCPPYTRGWKATIFPGTAAITVKSYDFANGVEITGATGKSVQVTMWDAPTDNSEGIAFFDQQTVPLVVDIVNTAPAGVLTIIPAPAVGRIRIYEIRLLYSLSFGASTSAGVLASYYDGALAVKCILEISPASPTDNQLFAAPGGDLAIGSPLNYVYALPDGVALGQPAVETIIRYAII
jgi:hypothetical protein